MTAAARHSRAPARATHADEETAMTNTKMVPMTMRATQALCVVIPLKTVNPLNSRRHFRAVAKQAKIDKTTVLAHLMSASGWRRNPAGEWVVTLTRLSAGTLDAHDNLRAALKHVADSTAFFLGLDDASPRITWQYDQKPVARGEYGVMVRIEARDVAT